MKIGTKSVLFGYHCVLLHWMFVARGWFHLYGFQRVRIGTKVIPIGMSAVPSSESTLRLAYFTSLWDPRLWIAFFIHDLGYWGKPNMDGPEGEKHPEWAARVMGQMFGEPWGSLCLYHSRFYAKLDHAAPSPLCFADKLAICYLPDWLYMKMIFATGEVHEYMRESGRMIGARVAHSDAKVWMADVKQYVWAWVEQHKDGTWDAWTPIPTERARETATNSGVWR
jgi:hypothetical protein